MSAAVSTQQGARRLDFHFMARCGEQTQPLKVSMPYTPGNAAPRAAGIAVGGLLAVLECEYASIDASQDGMVTVTIGQDIWVIDDARAKPAARGPL